MADVELLPCPFCGKTKTLVFDADEDMTAVCCSYACGGCGAEALWCDTKEEAAAAWNRRAFGKEIRLDGDTLYFEGLGTFKRVSE